MKLSFRQYMISNDFSFFIKEEGMPASPDNPDTTNKYHFDAIKKGFGMDDADFKHALEGAPIQIWQVPDYSSKWGFLVSGPCSAEVKSLNSGNYEIKFLLKDKKRYDPNSFILPYKQGERPTNYNGPVEDQTVFVSSEELQDMVSRPFADMQNMTQQMMSGPPAGM